MLGPGVGSPSCSWASPCVVLPPFSPLKTKEVELGQNFPHLGPVLVASVRMRFIFEQHRMFSILFQSM